MSYINARKQIEQQPQQVADSSLLCRVPGCGKRWAVDISHGKVCSDHDAQFSKSGSRRPPPTRSPVTPRPLPTLAEAVRPFIEPADRDEVEF